MKILTYPNPKLRQKSAKIKIVDEKIRQLVLDMLEIMKANKGLGLSAIQTGNPIRLIVAEYKIDKEAEKNFKTDVILDEEIPQTILINPKITLLSKEKETIDEGCLSLPGIEIPIERSKRAHILAQDLDGNKIKIRAKGIFARVLQHEIDHLDGILITDRINPKNLKKYMQNLKLNNQQLYAKKD